MDIRVLMALQDSVGTAKTTDMIQAYATNFNVKAETNKIESKVLGAGRWVKDTISGRRSVGGDFELEPNIDQVELLLQACGFKNGGADKTYKPSPFEKYLTLISDFPSDNLHIEYKDCLINTFGISVTQEGYVSTKVGIIGLSDELKDDKKANGLKSNGNNGAQLRCYGAKLSQSDTNGSNNSDISANVESVEITINNSLEGRGGLNSKHFTKILQSGRASIDVVVKFNAFEKENYKKALEMLKNNTALKLDLELSEDISDSKKGRKIEISLPNVKLASVDIDDIEGIGGLTRNMVALPKTDGGDPITFKIVEATESSSREV